MDNDEFDDADFVEFDDEDDDNFDDYDDEESVTLGFVEKPKNHWSLCSQYFPSKAGGLPAWLDPLNIPSGNSTMCDNCEEPLQFLLQVYAPIEKESTFHRTLFVFVCPSMTCLVRDQNEQWRQHPDKQYRSVKVLRCQLPRVNPFYSSECLKYDGSQKPVASGAALCDWCGTWKGAKRCGGCKQMWYCSKKHQSMSWISGHNIACQQMKVTSPVSGPNRSGTTSLDPRKVGCKTWPEFEIIIEDESQYHRNVSKDNTLANSLMFGNFQGDDDNKSWFEFSERVGRAPEQVLRYYRNTNAKPIWPISSGRPSKNNIPKCNYCGGAMCCEFQILPQLLHNFSVKNVTGSLDWASLFVYACEASCEASLPYKHEFAWVQLYSLSHTI